MELCGSCRAAIEPGRSHCRVCDTPVRPPDDPTQVPTTGFAPPGYGQQRHHPPQPVYPPQQHYPPQPVYGQPVYAVPTVAVPVAVASPLKSKATAALLCFFLGGLGIHRFYTGQTGLGVGFLVTTVVGWLVLLFLTLISFGILSFLYIFWAIGIFVWVLVDFCLILSGSVTDQYGRALT